jgi:hypothetical protein
MAKYEYEIEKHVKTEWIVTCRKKGHTGTRELIAKCTSEGAALTIKGMYEKDDKEIEGKEDE